MCVQTFNKIWLIHSRSNVRDFQKSFIESTVGYIGTGHAQRYPPCISRIKFSKLLSHNCIF